ncbi:MAG: ArsR family transcriptional regulator [Gemmatimonadales bacterium]|nr:MAG: ArsR family transcriptional regulator [Gemmatimonadales bacterium]
MKCCPDGLDRTFHALADEKRLAILARLTGGERCVCELTDEAGVGQSLLSFHLRVLKDAGLVQVRRVGRWGFYSVNLQAVSQLQEFLAGLGMSTSERIRCCADPGCACGSN